MHIFRRQDGHHCTGEIVVRRCLEGWVWRRRPTLHLLRRQSKHAFLVTVSLFGGFFRACSPSIICSGGVFDCTTNESASPLLMTASFMAPDVSMLIMLLLGAWMFFNVQQLRFLLKSWTQHFRMTGRLVRHSLGRKDLPERRSASAALERG